MKKRLLALAIATLVLCGSFVGCDVNGGLIGKLLSSYMGDLSPESLLEMLVGGAIQNELVGDMTAPNGDVVEIETDIQMDIPWPSETWVEETWEIETEYDATWEDWTEVDPVPDQTVDDAWDTGAPDVEQRPRVSDVIVLDGDLSDWQEHSHLWAPYDFDEYYLDSWVGEVGDKGFTMYTTSDMNYVYFAFDVRDDDVGYSDDGTYNMDAFQIQIDFSGWVADTEAFYRAIFYSFGLQEDMTMDVTVQCIMDDAASSIDYKMGSDDEEEWREGEIKGVTKKKEDGSGWIAEYAVSWETLYRDITQKLESQGEFVPDFVPGKDEVKLHMLICYLDHATNKDGSDAGIVGAWGTSQVKDALQTSEGWYPENAGVIAHYNTANGSAYIESLFQDE